MALYVFWICTTITLAVFLPMFFSNSGESFHPHSVSVRMKHNGFMIVDQPTECKHDFCVASISAFVAPRGSTSSKYFSTLCTGISISGFLGCYRWYKTGDASENELYIAWAGFLCLLLVSGFELDVLPRTFLSYKLRITKWLIDKLHKDEESTHPYFRLTPYTRPFPMTKDNLLRFVRRSPLIYHLFEEDHEIYLKYQVEQAWKAAKGEKLDDDEDHDAFQKHYFTFTSDVIYGTLHMVGAIGFVICVTWSILLNDWNEAKVGGITGTAFFIFSLLGYLTGNYVPLFYNLRTLILLWNPFLREPNFMYKLKLSLDAFKDDHKEGAGDHHAKVKHAMKKAIKNDELIQHSIRKPTISKKIPSKDDINPPSNPPTLTHQSSSIVEHIDEVEVPKWVPVNIAIDADMARLCDNKLNNFMLKYARRCPEDYLKFIGHCLVMSEVIAMLTPAVGMGIQWITALCKDPPVLVMMDMFWNVFECAYNLGQGCDFALTCALK